MHLVLDPAEDAAHGELLRQNPGAYEWWYFDALSDDGIWAFTVIFFLGNPFSPYYRLAASQIPANPFSHNAVFFALSRDAILHAYHFTRFPETQIFADDSRPATLRFGPNFLDFDGVNYALTLADENANRRRMTANLTFSRPNKTGESAKKAESGETHFWHPAAPSCRVTGEIQLTEKHNRDTEKIQFLGSGYHDHNRGTLPFAAEIQDWHWARADFGNGRTAIIYHVTQKNNQATSHFLIFDDGNLTSHDENARVTKSKRQINAFGTIYATQLDIESGDVSARFTLTKRLDSAPFYLRTLAEATLTAGNKTQIGRGLGEYFRPRNMANFFVASAMKARIMER